MMIEKYGCSIAAEFAKDISSPFFYNLLLAISVSLAVCLLNVATERWHGRYSMDLDTRGIQKVHKKSVPRTGGLALLAGVLAVVFYGNFEEGSAFAGHETRAAMANAPSADVASQPYQYIAGPSLVGCTRK